MDIQSLKAGFCGGGGNIIALVENGRLRQIAAVKGRQLQSCDL